MSAKPISLEVFEEHMKKNPTFDVRIEQLQNLFKKDSMDLTFKVVTAIEKVFCGNLLPSIHASMDALTDPRMTEKDKMDVKTEISQLCRSMELAFQGVIQGADIDFNIPLEPVELYTKFKKLQKKHEHLKLAQIMVNTALHEMEQQRIPPFDENIQLYSGCFHVDVSKADSDRMVKGWVSVILCPKVLVSAVKKFIDKPYIQGHSGSSSEFFDLDELSKEDC